MIIIVIYVYLMTLKDFKIFFALQHFSIDKAVSMTIMQLTTGTMQANGTSTRMMAGKAAAVTRIRKGAEERYCYRA